MGNPRSSHRTHRSHAEKTMSTLRGAREALTDPWKTEKPVVVREPEIRTENDLGPISKSHSSPKQVEDFLSIQQDSARLSLDSVTAAQRFVYKLIRASRQLTSTLPASVIRLHACSFSSQSDGEIFPNELLSVQLHSEPRCCIRLTVAAPIPIDSNST